MKYGVVLLIASISSPAISQSSQTCYFVKGPRVGRTQYFPNAQPVSLGGACNDGAASIGIAIQDGKSSPPGDFAFSAGQPTCSDPIGTPVPYQFRDGIPKSGLATISGNQPIIFLKPADFQQFSPAHRKFLVAHECGHHALGQVIGTAFFNAPIGPREELAADCFAANSLLESGDLSAGDLEEVLSFIRTLPGDAANVPGPQRVAAIRECSSSD